MTGSGKTAAARVRCKPQDGQLAENSETVIRRVVAKLRELMDASVQLSGSVSELEALEKDIDRTLGAARSLAVGKPMDIYGPFTTDEPNAVLPYSPVTGHYHPMAPPVELEFTEEKLVGRVRFGEAYEGPHDCVHGSIISAVYDQLLALANVAVGTGGPTASLTIHFRRPTPLYEALQFEAWTDRVDGRKVYAKGRCTHNGVLLSEAEGLFVQITDSSKHKPWTKNG